MADACDLGGDRAQELLDDALAARRQKASRPAARKPRGPLSTTRTASTVMKPFPLSGARRCRGLSAAYTASKCANGRG